MFLLNQTLTNSENQAVLQAAGKFGDDQFLTYHDEQTERDPTLEPFLQESEQYLLQIHSGILIQPSEIGGENILLRAF